MNIFHRRHLALFCCIFAATSIGGCFLDYGHKASCLIYLLGITLATVVVSLLIKKHKASIFKLALCMLFAFLALLFQFVTINLPSKQTNDYIGDTATITATVRSVELSENFLSLYVAEIDSLNDENVNIKAILECEYNAELEIGERICGDFIFESINNYTETPSYYLAKGISCYIHSSENLTSSLQKKDLATRFAIMNRKLGSIITNKLEGDAGDFVSALVLGNKDGLDASITRDFRRAGLSHILAISGLHLSILMFFGDFILKKLKLSKSVRGGIVILGALFYLALTGFYVSTVRAFVMTTIVYLAYVFRSESDMLTSLFLSLFVIITFSPYSVYDIGLWLSFLAVLGIFVAQYFIQLLSDALYAKYLREKHADKYKIKRKAFTLTKRKIRVILYVFSSIAITAFANIFICVPAWLYFDEISLISIASNLVASPIVAMILYIVPVFMATSFIPALSGAIGSVLSFAVNLLLKIASVFSSANRITVSLNYKFTGIITIFLAISLAICLVMKFKRKWIIVIPPLLAAIAFSCGVYYNNLFYKNIVQIEYVGGQSSEMLLLRDKNDYTIIDVSNGGSAYSQDAYSRSLDNCATEISSYVITHYHNYHQNSVRKILKKAIVRRLLLPYPQNLDEYYVMVGLVNIAQSEGVDIMLYDSQKAIRLSSNVDFALSERHYLMRSQHPTFYFTIDSYGQRFTYLGESVFEANGVEKELNTAMDSSDYILFGGHGPITKATYEQVISLYDKSVMVANEEVNSAFDIRLYGDSEFHYGTQYCKIYINKNNK